MIRILIVDDEPRILRALRVNLQARSYDVITAGKGGEALHSAATHHPDVVVLDLGLPDIDGIEVIRKLRTWTPISIVILSGRMDSAGKVHAKDLRQYMKHLRRKLEDDPARPRYLITEPGMGYRFQP